MPDEPLRAQLSALGVRVSDSPIVDLTLAGDEPDLRGRAPGAARLARLRCGARGGRLLGDVPSAARRRADPARTATGETARRVPHAARGAFANPPRRARDARVPHAGGLRRRARRVLRLARAERAGNLARGGMAGRAAAARRARRGAGARAPQVARGAGGRVRRGRRRRTMRTRSRIPSPPRSARPTSPTRPRQAAWRSESPTPPSMAHACTRCSPR